jgi:hypothetical protein
MKNTATTILPPNPFAAGFQNVINSDDIGIVELCYVAFLIRFVGFRQKDIVNATQPKGTHKILFGNMLLKEIS